MNKPDFIKEVLFEEKEVKNRILDIRKIIFDYYKSFENVKVFSVLKGGEYLSKLLALSSFDKKFQENYISANSYLNNKKLPNNKINIDFMGNKIQSLWGEQILIIDDIYDTGNTLKQIYGKFAQKGAIVQNVVLIKRKNNQFEIPILTYGCEIEQKDYLVGCGLDYNNGYRQLPYIASIKD